MLVVFDIDGTLTRTYDLDGALYARAFAETFGQPLPSLEWTTYRHVTDRGIAEEALARLGLRASSGDVERFSRRFIESLDRALRPDAERQVAGAAAILDRLRLEGHTVAFATGAWAASARLKLSRSFIEIDRAVLATCDDEPDRLAILASAIERSSKARRPDRVVYVGDGPWDAAAARALGIPFIGIDHDVTGRLGSGAEPTVLRDFSDADAFLRAALRAGI